MSEATDNIPVTMNDLADHCAKSLGEETMAKLDAEIEPLKQEIDAYAESLTVVEQKALHGMIDRGFREILANGVVLRLTGTSGERVDQITNRAATYLRDLIAAASKVAREK